MIASHAVNFRGLVLPPCGEECNTSPLKTTAWEANFMVVVSFFVGATHDSLRTSTVCPKSLC